MCSLLLLLSTHSMLPLCLCPLLQIAWSIIWCLPRLQHALALTRDDMFLAQRMCKFSTDSRLDSPMQEMPNLACAVCTVHQMYQTTRPLYAKGGLYSFSKRTRPNCGMQLGLMVQDTDKHVELIGTDRSAQPPLLRMCFATLLLHAVMHTRRSVAHPANQVCDQEADSVFRSWRCLEL